eukprot:scaffold23300_cov21-Tisochrysis_lutea.AAC.1
MSVLDRVARWSSALLATNTFHQRRTLLTFQRVASDLGIHCQGRHCPDSVCLRQELDAAIFTAAIY